MEDKAYRFEVGQTVIFVDPFTFVEIEFQVAHIARSSRGCRKDLLEDKGGGLNVRAEFCKRNV